MASLRERLRDRNSGVFDDAVRDAVVEGTSGEAELVAVLRDLPESRILTIVAALGDAQGVAGPAALREIFGAATKRDVQCAAVLALAKRCGPDATADLAAALANRDSAVKNYAMVGLAGAGDDVAWEAAFVRLKQLLRRPGVPPKFSLRFLSVQSPVAAAICYLGRHLDDDRTVRLVSELRKRWDHVGGGEREWLAEVWRDCLPGGPQESEVAAPDGERLQRWIRDPLFGPVF